MDRIRLETKHVSIELSGVKALDDINFETSTDEIRAVVGANSAGKSTLIEALAGANSTYSGEVLLDGKKVEVRISADAKKLGIQIVYQEVDMAPYPTLSVAENIVQSDMVMEKSGYIVNWRKVHKQEREALDRLHTGRDQVDEYGLVQNLSLAQKQIVFIVKVIRSERGFLILDEPIAPLSDTETGELFRIIKHLHETEDIATLLISHRLNEILEACGNYTVVRNGRVIDTTPVTGETTTKEIVEKMLGRKFEENFPKEACQVGEMLFWAEDLSGAGNKVKDMSMQVKKGEVVGIVGLVGVGKSELCKTVFGAYKKTGGKALLKNQELKTANPSGAVKNRMALAPEEWRKEGALVNENVNFNLSATRLSRLCTGPFIRRRKVGDNVRRFVGDLGISTPNVRQQAKNLSDGNQQEVAVGRWPVADCNVHILDELIKGVDVGVGQDIFHLINETAKQGNCIIYASCENSELLSLTNRMYVMYNGMVMTELEAVKTTEDEIMFYSAGGKNNRDGK